MSSFALKLAVLLRLRGSIFVGVLSGLAVVMCYSCAAGVEILQLRTAVESITSSELKKHVEVLADDTFEGRKAGSRGGRAAAMYLLNEFETHSLKPAGTNGGFFQAFGAGYRNILGMIEGSDPILKDEFIVVGAHYDHVGYGSRRDSFGPTGYIHNGADDNASGTAGVLETIDAFSVLDHAPRRSVLFALWDGEEMGLLGSKHWVTQPTVNLNRVKCVLNVDMIGRLTKHVDVYGTRTGNGLRRTVVASNSSVGLTLDFTWEMKENSDHYPFFQRNIPALMLHTGLHDDYHRPSDDAHKVNADGMRDIVHILFQLTNELADQEQIEPFRSASRYETVARQKQFELPLAPAPPRLGVWMQDSDAGVVLTRIGAGTAADRAGLRVGDRIIKFSDAPVLDQQHFISRILQSESKTQAIVIREDEDESLTLPVELDGKPVRIGIAWREDLAVPGTVMLTQIRSGSPAQIAGLRVHDRIYSVGGNSFADSNDLLTLMTTLPSPLDLLIERQGRTHTVKLDVPTPLETSVGIDE